MDIVAKQLYRNPDTHLNVTLTNNPDETVMRRNFLR